MNRNKYSNNANCPICNSSTQKLKNLNSNFIKNKLSEHFNKQLVEDVEIIDYSLLKCNNCNFEYAYPLIEGSSSFYNWVTSQIGYYPDTRWEYGKVVELIVNKRDQENLLDVGCGDGKFLDFIKKNHHETSIEAFGLDLTKESVEKCLLKGHKVYNMDVKQFKLTYNDIYFDVITAFHVLEHIADPKDFLMELFSLINPGGAVYVSTPYSPMDFEVEWFDVLNHPPHHMGRWNLKSYKILAETLGLKSEFFMPRQGKLITSAIKSFLFSIDGNLGKKDKKTIIKSIIKRPFQFLTHFWKQLQRDKIMGKRAANVILVKFTK